MSYTITVDVSAIVDLLQIDAADVLVPIANLKSAIEALGDLAGTPPQVCNGRLTLTSGLAVTTADVTAATSIYFTPYLGNRIAIYDGSKWVTYTFAELTLSLALLTASRPHDVFAYISAGAVTLEAVAWTSDTARATAITLQDGVYCKSGTLTRRYIGTFRTTSTIGQCEDSYTKRFVWNMHNRVPRVMRVRDTTDSWTYATASYRSWNNSTANRVEFVRGVSEDPVTLNFAGLIISAGAVNGALGIGLGSTSANSAWNYTYSNNSTIHNIRADYKDTPALGYNFLQLLEYSSGATSTFYGDVGFAYVQTGAIGELAA